MTITTTLPMLQSYPAEITMDRGRLAATIDALIACSEACTACADACLSEAMIAQLGKCIRTNMDCADVCSTTARVLSRHTGYDANLSRALLGACVTACRSCGDECGKHEDFHEHCRICAESSRVCEKSCAELMVAMV